MLVAASSVIISPASLSLFLSLSLSLSGFRLNGRASDGNRLKVDDVDIKVAGEEVEALDLCLPKGCGEQGIVKNRLLTKLTVGVHDDQIIQIDLIDLSLTRWDACARRVSPLSLSLSLSVEALWLGCWPFQME